MRKIILATAAAAIMCAPMASAVRAEDSTTVIKRDNDGDSSKTVIKKKDDVNLLPVPHTEQKTIIKKENE